MKRCVFLLCVCFALTLALTACAPSEPAPTPTPSPSPTFTQSAEPLPDESGGGNEGNPGEIEIPATSVERNAELVVSFTPDGAEVITDVAGELILTSTKSMDELAEFFRVTAAPRFGVADIATDTPREGYRTLTGSYGGGLTLTVEVRDDGESRNVLVNY